MLVYASTPVTPPLVSNPGVLPAATVVPGTPVNIDAYELLVHFVLNTVRTVYSLFQSQPATAAVLEQILKATETTSAMKGADERELVLGRLLGVSSLALSGRLGSDPESAEGALKVGRNIKRRYSRSR